MPDSLIRFVLRYSRKQQIWLVFMTFFSFPFLYLSLEIPKIIVNEVLSQEVGQRSLLGFEFEPVPLLIALSISFLILVLIGGLLKMYLNTHKGIVGETVVRRLRYMLVQRLLLFPPSHFNDLSEGEVIAAVVQETDPLGGFAADAFALPVFQGGTLLTILLFLFMQNWMIGVASVIAVPLQMYLIPYLQRKINKIREQRVKRVRKLSTRLGETVQAANEIRAQGTREYTLAEFSYRFGRLYYNRRELFKKKFFLKFVNNFLNQITPFLFYAVGGYLVLQGELTIGALVAALSAHKNFVAPWRELLNFYRIWQDNIVRYREVINRFHHPAIEQSPELDDPANSAADTTDRAGNKHTAEAAETSDNAKQHHAESPWQQNLIVRDVKLLNNRHEVLFATLNFQLEPNEWVAVAADNPQLRQAFAHCLSGLEAPRSGFVGFGEQALQQLPEAELRQNMGLVDATPHLFNTSVFYNLAYGLNHQPPDIKTDQQQQIQADALAAGNSGQWFDDDFTTSWANLSRFETDDWDSMQDWLQAQFDIIGLTDELCEQALEQVFNPADFPEELFAELTASLLAARTALHETIVEKDGDTLSSFCPYAVSKLNHFAPLADNLVFGALAQETLAKRAHGAHSVQALMTQAMNDAITEKLSTLLCEHKLLTPSLGIAQKSLQKLLADYDADALPADHRFMDSFELHQEGRIDELRALLERLQDDVASTESEADAGESACCAELMDVFLRLVPADWFGDDLPDDYIAGLIAVRTALMEWLKAEFAADYYPFVADEYNPGLSVIENVLFGRINPACTNTQKDMHEHAVHQIMDETSQYALIRVFLMSAQVGVGGSRLSERLRQQIQLLRTLVKRPTTLIMQDVLSGHDETEKIAMLHRLRDAQSELTLVWICDEMDDEWNDELTNTALFNRYLQLSQNELVPYDEAGGEAAEDSDSEA